MLPYMVQLARFVRSVFGAEAAFGLLALASLTWRIDFESAGSWVLPFMIVLMGTFSLVNGAAWWTLRKGKPTAGGWAIAASVLNLPLFPLGTAIGIAGLSAFFKPALVAQTAISTSAVSIPGDGTNKFAGAAVTALQTGLLILGLYWWYRRAKSEGLILPDFWISLLQINLAIFVSTLCHELGHVLGGWATEMSLRSLTVGPLRLERRSGKWNCKFSLAGLLGNGSAGLVPTHLLNIRKRLVIMIAAGPAASLLTAVVVTPLALSAAGHAWAPGWEFLAVLATLSWIGVSNLLPVRPEDKYSDGAQIYQLLSNGPWADFHMAFSMVASSLATPLRARDFDVAVLERAAAFMPGDHRGMLLQLYLYMHHTDCGNIAEGLRHFAIAESMYPQVAASLEADLHLEFVYVNAVVKQDTAAARLWWERMEAKGKVRQNVDYWKARAALLWAEGSVTEAREACRRAEACARELPDAGAYNRDREEVARLSANLERAEVPPPLPVPQVA
jgi:hypothetical protein